MSNSSSLGTGHGRLVGFRRSIGSDWVFIVLTLVFLAGLLALNIAFRSGPDGGIDQSEQNFFGAGP